MSAVTSTGMDLKTALSNLLKFSEFGVFPHKYSHSLPLRRNLRATLR
jgi:hypothetical protein